MPLSTVLGAQSLIKPGVCTTATRPASPYEGQAIYDTDVATTLVWDGSAWIGGAGKILQVVQATSTTLVTSSSTTFVTSGLAVTITPTSATSTILVMANTGARNSSVSYVSVFTLFRGTVAGTNLGEASNGMLGLYSGTNPFYTQVAVSYIDSPATTSATTYTLGMKVNNAANTVYAQNATLGGTGGRGSIIVMEVSA